MSAPVPLVLQDQNVFLVLPTVQQPILAIQTPAQPKITLPASNALTLALPAPVRPILQLTQQVAIFQIIVAEETAIGPAGPQGTRGSLFLGGYPSLANLPAPNGIDIRPGDFAFVQDTSTIYEVR